MISAWVVGCLASHQCKGFSHGLTHGNLPRPACSREMQDARRPRGQSLALALLPGLWRQQGKHQLCFSVPSPAALLSKAVRLLFSDSPRLGSHHVAPGPPGQYCVASVGCGSLMEKVP